MEFLELSFVEMVKKVDAMSTKERGDMCGKLEILSRRAAQMSGYLDERYGCGCRDQGHEQAVKQLNHCGRTVWMKAFGYNAYRDVRF
jgi:hypothetical protein